MADVKSARDYRAEDTLRNGLAIVIRAVRPDDHDRLANAFKALERETVYTRFFGYKQEITDAEFAQVDAMDFVRDVMLVVTTQSAAGEIVIGGSRYIAHDAGSGRLVAEVAFTIEEDYQGLGIASRLLQHLAGIARQSGIASFEAEVLAGNKAMLAVFERSGLPMSRAREGGVVHLTLDLAQPS
jgi:GNAT superfamily N-acetyltransferase